MAMSLKHPRNKRTRTEAPERAPVALALWSEDPDRLRESRIDKAKATLQELTDTDWNGFVEMTDEARFGYVLFEVNGPSQDIRVTTPLKRRVVQRLVHTISARNFQDLYVSISRHANQPTVFDLILRCMEEREVEKYVNEYGVFTSLLEKMRRETSAYERWIPSFAPSLQRIDEILNSHAMYERHEKEVAKLDGYNLTPRTLGQWFLLALSERFKRRIVRGIHMKTLLYAVSWLTKILEDQDRVAICASTVAILAWITEDTCSDCLIKTLRVARRDLVLEYRLQLTDSFSAYFRIQERIIKLAFGNCENGGDVSSAPPTLRSIALRTYGEHSFLTSAHAQTSEVVEVRIEEGRPPLAYKLTRRQTYSIISMLDLHSRVLRAHPWGHAQEVFDTWIRERRIETGDEASDLYTLIIPDLAAAAKVNAALTTAVGHLVPLLITKKLSKQLLRAFMLDRRANEEVQAFLVRYVFTVAPDPNMQALADDLLKRHGGAGAEPRRVERVTYELNHGERELQLSPEDQDLEERWGIAGCDDDDIYDYYGGRTITKGRTPRPMTDSEEVSDAQTGLGPGAAALMSELLPSSDSEEERITIRDADGIPRIAMLNNTLTSLYLDAGSSSGGGTPREETDSNENGSFVTHPDAFSTQVDGVFDPTESAA